MVSPTSECDNKTKYFKPFSVIFVSSSSNWYTILKKKKFAFKMECFHKNIQYKFNKMYHIVDIYPN